MNSNTIGSYALAFVVVSRLVVFAMFLAVATPVAFVTRRLPKTSGPSFPRLARARKWVVSHLASRSPSWVERHDKGMIKLKTTRGSDYLDAVVARVPDRVFEWWRRFGVAVMTVFLVVWGVAFLAYVGFTLRVIAQIVPRLVNTAVASVAGFDWRSLLERRERPPMPDLTELVADVVASIPELVVGLAMVVAAGVIGLAVYTVAMWLLMLPLLPGLLLHEFGHYAAIRKSGASVDEFGLLLYGPVLVGAYVEPGDDAEELDIADSFGMWAGGIANTMLWGLCLIGLGIGLGASVPAVVSGIQSGDIAVVISQGLPALVVLIGIFEVVNAFLNTIPIGPVDGGGFIREAEQELFGIQDLKTSPLSAVMDR